MYLCVVVVSVSIFVSANVSADDELPAVFRDQGFITQQEVCTALRLLAQKDLKIVQSSVIL